MNVPGPFAVFDPTQLAFAAGQELYKSSLLSSINTRRMFAGRPPAPWPNVADTPNEVLWREGPALLRRYFAPGQIPSRGPRTAGAPLLLVCSLINRPYVLDILPERSVVRRLLAEGFDVWLLDWGTPVAADASRTLADYAAGTLPRAAAAVCAETGAPRVHLLGYCMGGTFALIAAAAEAMPVASILALATPVDLHDRGLLSAWCRAPGLDPQEMAQAYGNIPPWLMQPAFKMLDPVGLLSKWKTLEGKLLDDEFVRFFLAMESWLEDSVAFPGRAFADWVGLYRENGLVRGTLRVGGRPVDLGRVRCPILNVFAEGDYITPSESPRALDGKTGSARYEEIKMPGGHIGLSTGGAAHRDLWPRAARWLRECERPSAVPTGSPAASKVRPPPDAPAAKTRDRITKPATETRDRIKKPATKTRDRKKAPATTTRDRKKAPAKAAPRGTRSRKTP